jgi:hypothetical protein
MSSRSGQAAPKGWADPKAGMDRCHERFGFDTSQTRTGPKLWWNYLTHLSVRDENMGRNWK